MLNVVEFALVGMIVYLLHATVCTYSELRSILQQTQNEDGMAIGACEF